MPPNKENPSSNVLKKENPMVSTVLKLKTTNEVVANFFINTLPITSGDTDYESFNETIQELYANAATLPKNMSEGKLLEYLVCAL